MTGSVAATCLVLSALALLWPTRGNRSRLRAVLPVTGTRRGAAARGSGRWRGRWRPAALGAPGRVARILPVVAAVVAAGALGGVVAGIAAGIYGLLVVRALASRGAERARAASRRELLDHLTSAAADLRAGLPFRTAMPDPAGEAGSAGQPLVGQPKAVTPESGDDLLRYRVRAAAALAERTGAPLAELLDRIEADARAADRARAGAAAQAAGARATAWLLAGLPAGGLALGFAIGADPVAVLLHTPVGAVSALGAIALQVAGLAWTRRIMLAGGAVR